MGLFIPESPTKPSTVTYRFINHSPKNLLQIHKPGRCI
ncbi:unnamed protein product [Arabidopsis halleri]